MITSTFSPVQIARPSLTKVETPKIKSENTPNTTQPSFEGNHSVPNDVLALALIGTLMLGSCAAPPPNSSGPTQTQGTPVEQCIDSSFNAYGNNLNVSEDGKTISGSFNGYGGTSVQFSEDNNAIRGTLNGYGGTQLSSSNDGRTISGTVNGYGGTQFNLSEDGTRLNGTFNGYQINLESQNDGKDITGTINGYGIDLHTSEDGKNITGSFNGYGIHLNFDDQGNLVNGSFDGYGVDANTCQNAQKALENFEDFLGESADFKTPILLMMLSQKGF